MNRPLEQLWNEIEASMRPQSAGWIRRLANPGAAVPVHAAVSCIGGVRSLMIDIPVAALGGLQALPLTGGLSVTLLPQLDGHAADQRSLAVALDDAQYADVFAIFCSDLVDGLSRCARVGDAMVMLLRRLARWQALLGRASQGLNQNEVVGLFGELWVLREILVPAGGIGLLAAWSGAQRAPQDFIVPGACAIEVKTSLAAVLSHVRIHGERQLDDSGLARLYLTCLRVERDGQGAESLNDVVGDLRAMTAVVPEFSSLFDRLLAQAGWMTRHAHLYESFRLRVAQTRHYRVDQRLPRLTSAALACGVGDVDYLLDLKACAACECTQDDLIGALCDLKLQAPSPL